MKANLVSLFIVIAFASCSNETEEKVVIEPKVFKCSQALIPEFTLNRDSDPIYEEIEKLCKCVWNNLNIGNQKISKRISLGQADISQEEINTFSRGFGLSINKCGGEDL